MGQCRLAGRSAIKSLIALNSAIGGQWSANAAEGEGRGMWATFAAAPATNS